jgi:hypothetical protein
MPSAGTRSWPRSTSPVAFARLLDGAVANGGLEEIVDTETEAALLLTVVDGLVVQALALPQADRQGLVTHSLDTHLDRLSPADVVDA